MGFPCPEVVTCQKDVIDVRCPRLGTSKEGMGAGAIPWEPEVFRAIPHAALRHPS